LGQRGRLRQDLAHRPNLRHTAHDTTWLFPSTNPGRHVAANTVMTGVRELGINLLAARNAALRELVTQAPAPSSPLCSATATPSPPGTPA
jgi:sorbitol-specific phosphotransferase system component IIC